MNQTLRKLVTAGALGLASMLPMRNAESQNINANVDIAQSEVDSVSFIRPNLFYKIAGVDGYTFVEFYRNDTFFGKTMLNRKLGKGFKAGAEIIYGSKFEDIYGLGASYDVPMPKGSFLNLKVLPAWTDKKRLIENKVQAGYFGGMKLPAGFNLSAFG